jgi:hypothetical protein
MKVRKGFLGARLLLITLGDCGFSAFSLALLPPGVCCFHYREAMLN